MGKPDRKPVFEPVFAEGWKSLPPVLQKHYAPRAHSKDMVVLQGEMRFAASRLARVLSPLLRLGGMLPLFNASGIPATVQIAAKPDDAAVVFHRAFRPEGRKPFTFLTTMQPQPDGTVIDWTPGGIGWNMQMRYENGKVRMRHIGYVGRVGKLRVALPLGWLLGECNAWEEPLGDNRFAMRMELTRGGKLFYAYSGEFEVAGVIRRD